MYAIILPRGDGMEDLFEYYIETDDYHLKYAKGEPAVKNQEFHDYNEFVYFIGGKSLLVSKNIRQELTTGSIVMIPQEQFHQFFVSQPEEYVRCILGFRKTPENHRLISEVMKAIKVIAVPDKNVSAEFQNLIEIIKSELSREEKEMYIQSSLIHLLIYLKLHPYETANKSTDMSPVISKALDLIDEKYADNLTVESIAGQLYISPSTLSHKFKKELNISVYQYITKKRLSVANNLIHRGEPLTSAALNSGFNDYSCFYRLYKKYYK